VAADVDEAGLANRSLVEEDNLVVEGSLVAEDTLQEDRAVGAAFDVVVEPWLAAAPLPVAVASLEHNKRSTRSTPSDTLPESSLKQTHASIRARSNKTAKKEKQNKRMEPKAKTSHNKPSPFMDKPENGL
jgi:hypothetical protein